MASLMDMRELGMLRNATQRMDRGGGIDMEEWRRRKAAEEQSAAEQAIALAQADPRYQALISGASGGPAAVGSIGNVVKSLPFLRHAGPLAKGAAAIGRGIKRSVWTPGTKQKVSLPPHKIVTPGTSGRPSGAGLYAIEAAALGGGGYVANRAGLLGASPDIAPGITQARVGPSTDGTIIPEEPSPPLPFSPDMLEAMRSGGAKHHVGMPTLEAKEKLASVATNNSDETKENKPSLWTIWGSLADNPKERKKAYIGSLKRIFMKRLLLDGIAQLTGGVSQGSVWAASAIAELDAMEKFDSEERLHQQWKALFFNEDGTYNPPKNRKEAMERGGELGYSHAQMKDILSIFPKAKSDIPLQQTVEYILSLPEGSVRKALMIKYGLMEEDKKDTEYAPGALEKNIKYLKNSFDFSEETIKKIIEMQVGLRAKAGTARDDRLQENLLIIWRAEGKATAGGLKDSHANYVKWLESPAGQATVLALTGGQSSNSSIIEGSLTTGDIKWNVD